MDKVTEKALILETNKSLIAVLKNLDELLNHHKNVDPNIINKLTDCAQFLKQVVNLIAFDHGGIMGDEMREEIRDESPISTQ